MKTFDEAFAECDFLGESNEDWERSALADQDNYLLSDNFKRLVHELAMGTINDPTYKKIAGTIAAALHMGIDLGLKMNSQDPSILVRAETPVRRETENTPTKEPQE